jgi:serine phosphatase RsbU (regulator of sigma subunit)
VSLDAEPVLSFQSVPLVSTALLKKFDEKINLPGLRRFQWLRYTSPRRRVLYIVLLYAQLNVIWAFGWMALRYGVPKLTVSLFAVAFAFLFYGMFFLLTADFKKKFDLEVEQVAAREIQRCFLPTELPTESGLEFAGHCKTFSDVGGDYYDAFRREDGSLFLVVADVSGKGTPAALVMANLQAILHSSSSESLTAIASKLHQHLLHHTESKRYVTAFLAHLNTAAGTLDYVNAGHEPPIFCSDGLAKRLTVGGLPLGLLNLPAIYESERIELPKRFMLAIFTDGLSDWEVSSGKTVGDVLPGLMAAAEQTPAAEVLKAAFNAGSSSKPMFDDATLLLVKSVGWESAVATSH